MEGPDGAEVASTLRHPGFKDGLRTLLETLYAPVTQESQVALFRILQPPRASHPATEIIRGDPYYGYQPPITGQLLSITDNCSHHGHTA